MLSLIGLLLLRVMALLLFERFVLLKFYNSWILDWLIEVVLRILKDVETVVFSLDYGLRLKSWVDLSGDLELVFRLELELVYFWWFWCGDNMGTLGINLLY